MNPTSASKLFARHSSWAALVLVTRCSIVTVDEHGKDVEHHFGYVQVRTTSSEERVEVYAITTLGAHISQGGFLGIRREEKVLVPLDTKDGEPGCTVTIVVKSRQQARLASELAEYASEGDICTVHL